MFIYVFVASLLTIRDAILRTHTSTHKPLYFYLCEGFHRHYYLLQPLTIMIQMKWSRWVFQLQQTVWVSDRVAPADRLKENDQMSALKSGTLQDKNVPVSERRSWRKVSKAHCLTAPWCSLQWLLLHRFPFINFLIKPCSSETQNPLRIQIKQNIGNYLPSSYWKVCNVPLFMSKTALIRPQI